MADTDLIERLNGWFTDWNGERMVPGEPPRDGIHCDILMEAAAALAEQTARIVALKAAVAVQRESKEYAQRCCITAETALTASRAECEGLRAALEEGAEILANLTASIRKNGNYSPESTVTFLEQIGQCLWEANSSLAKETA